MTDNTTPSDEACVWAHDARWPDSAETRSEKIAWVRNDTSRPPYRAALEYDSRTANALPEGVRDKLLAVLRGVDTDDARELVDALDPMDPTERAAREYLTKLWPDDAEHYRTVKVENSHTLQVFIAGWTARDKQEQGHD